MTNQTGTSEYKIKIEQDTDTENPRDFGTGIMVCFHGKYDLGNTKHKEDGSRFDDVYEAQEFHKNFEGVSLPLFLYDHGSITISTTPFSCPWDSGQVGFIYMPDEMLAAEFDNDKEKAKQCLLSEVQTYDQYLTGDVWGYIITKDGEEIDSCWGWYGRDDVQAEAEAVVEYWKDKDD